MLNKEEILRLQKLSAISLDDKEIEKLGNQLADIVNFLGKLKDISGEINYDIFYDNSLMTISEVDKYDDYKELFNNSKHDKIGNSIVVNSVVDN